MELMLRGELLKVSKILDGILDQFKSEEQRWKKRILWAEEKTRKAIEKSMSWQSECALLQTKLDDFFCENCLLKDDKIVALRNTARALEHENILLQDDKEQGIRSLTLERDSLLRQLEFIQLRYDRIYDEQKVRDGERCELFERIAILEEERLASIQKTISLKSELDATNALQSNTNDALCALRGGKHLVEEQFQTLVGQNLSLEEEVVVCHEAIAMLEKQLMDIKHDETVSDELVSAPDNGLAWQILLRQRSSFEGCWTLSMKKTDENHFCLTAEDMNNALDVMSRRTNSIENKLAAVKKSYIQMETSCWSVVNELKSKVDVLIGDLECRNQEIEILEAQLSLKNLT